jgi:hypothetical protein
MPIAFKTAVSEMRLSLTPSGNIRYQLKTPYSDGATHVIFAPLDFIARLSALVPRPTETPVRAPARSHAYQAR